MERIVGRTGCGDAHAGVVLLGLGCRTGRPRGQDEAYGMRNLVHLPANVRWTPFDAASSASSHALRPNGHAVERVHIYMFEGYETMRKLDAR